MLSRFRHGLFLPISAAVCVQMGVPFPAAGQPGQAPPPGREAPPRAAPGFEQRVYDLSLVLLQLQDYPAPDIELRSPSGGAGLAGASFSLEEVAGGALSGEDVVNLIRANIAEDTWSDKRTSLGATDEQLVVVQTPDIHAKIAGLLAHLRSEVERQISVTGTIALVEDALLEEWRAAPGSAVLSESAAQALAEALEKGERAVPVRSLRAHARNGQRVSMTSLMQHAYVMDYDVEVTTAATAFDPIVGYLPLGAVLDVRPTYTRGHLACEVRFARQDGAVPIPRFAAGVPGMGAIGLPQVTYDAVKTTVTGGDGQTIIAGRAALAGPKDAPGGRSRSLCFFIRPSLIPVEAAPPPASEEKRQMRIFDVGVLTTPLRDFPGPGVDVVPSGAAAIEASEFREVIPAETLVESIRHNVAPDSWENLRNSIESRGSVLFVRQTPEVLDAIANYLDALAARRWRMISTRVDLIVADPAAYRTLLSSHPSLGAGAARLEAKEVTELLARAAKGDGIAIAASGEVAGMNRQRVHVRRTPAQAYVRDYDIELATLMAVHDPQIDVLAEGVVVDCRPVLGGDGKTVHAELRVTLARLEQPIAVEAVNEKGATIHRPAAAVTLIRTSVIAGAGEVMLIGSGGPVRMGEGEKHVLAVVRFTPAP